MADLESLPCDLQGFQLAAFGLQGRFLAWTK